MSDTPQPPVAIIGLGAMGGGLASRLLDLGCRVSVYNRTAAAAEPFVARGARLAATPADAVQPGGIAFSSVADDGALEAVSSGPQGLVAGLGRGGLHVSMSTVSADAVRRLAAEHQAAGSQLVSAPVFGRGEAAAAGKLWIAMSGADSAKSRAEPLLRRLGQGLFDLGLQPEAAIAAKLAGNFLIITATEAMSEAFAFLRKSGVDPAAFHALMTESVLGAAIYRNYGPLMIGRKFSPPGFKLGLAAKDIGLANAAAADSATPMPLAALVAERLAAAVAAGKGDLDITALAGLAAQDAGLQD